MKLAKVGIFFNKKYVFTMLPYSWGQNIVVLPFYFRIFLKICGKMKKPAYFTDLSQGDYSNITYSRGVGGYGVG